MDSLSDSSLSILNTWLQWISVLSIGLGLVAAIGLLFVSGETGRRQERQLAEANKRIADLQPKPLSEQLLAVLNEIDPGIAPRLKTGINVELAGFIKQSQKDTLDRLFADPECSKYITPLEHGESHGIGDAGPTAYVKFVIGTNLLHKQ